MGLRNIRVIYVICATAITACRSRQLLVNSPSFTNTRVSFEPGRMRRTAIMRGSAVRVVNRLARRLYRVYRSQKGRGYAMTINTTSRPCHSSSQLSFIHSLGHHPNDGIWFSCMHVCMAASDCFCRHDPLQWSTECRFRRRFSRLPCCVRQPACLR